MLKVADEEYVVKKCQDIIANPSTSDAVWYQQLSNDVYVSRARGLVLQALGYRDTPEDLARATEECAPDTFDEKSMHALRNILGSLNYKLTLQTVRANKSGFNAAIEEMERKNERYKSHRLFGQLPPAVKHFHQKSVGHHWYCRAKVHGRATSGHRHVSSAAPAATVRLN